MSKCKHGKIFCEECLEVVLDDLMCKCDHGVPKYLKCSRCQDKFTGGIPSIKPEETTGGPVLL